MKVKEFILVCCLLLLITGCCKEEIIEKGNTFFGTWEIHEISSVVHSHLRGRDYMFIDSIPGNSKITFNNDSTGYFHDSIPGTVFIENLDFVWHHERLQTKLTWTFADGEGYAMIENQVEDKVELYAWDYKQRLGGPVVYYWKILLSKVID